MTPLCVAVLVGLLALAQTATKVPENINEILYTLGRQLMLQKLYLEESTRATYASGLKQVRRVQAGTRPYHHDTWRGVSVAAIHNHGNYERTMGIGEFVAILNGVEFKTRHNDYLLRMPHRTKKTYNLMEDIPFPAVPPAVLKFKTVKTQATEMREWFKAWKDQDYSKRDYRKYFKPVLCYLEGSWIHSGTAIEESFGSERHHLDAQTWFDMQEMVRYTAMSGTKDKLENYSFLPTSIVRMNGSTPVVAQWNYRILCHPLKNDLPLNRFRPVANEAVKMGFGVKKAKILTYRSTRFELNAFDTNKFKDGPIVNQLLDKLMGEIPGKDNYPGVVYDTSFGRVAQQYNGKKKGVKKLNTAFYHRIFSDTALDAMGRFFKYRSLQDQNIFMAQTTNPKVPAIEIETNCKGTGPTRKCIKSKSRWTYAVPLEIVYMTPLSRWNPHKIVYKGHELSKLGKTVHKGRNGGLSLKKAFNGSNTKWYCLTPANFYSNKASVLNPADTSIKGAVGVLKKNGKVFVANYYSGHQLFLRDIPGVGSLRQRYPIFPVAYDGNPIMKEVQAVRDQLTLV
ncbi:hypothetical protein LSAT2_021180 [Lamellibrachia satsuma]|nr:hypothetical protein LSAT2_021180 [Lamellibrachia satsuma]